MENERPEKMPEAELQPTEQQKQSTEHELPSHAAKDISPAQSGPQNIEEPIIALVAKCEPMDIPCSVASASENASRSIEPISEAKLGGAADNTKLDDPMDVEGSDLSTSVDPNSISSGTNLLVEHQVENASPGNPKEQSLNKLLKPDESKHEDSTPDNSIVPTDLNPIPVLSNIFPNPKPIESKTQTLEVQALQVQINNDSTQPGPAMHTQKQIKSETIAEAVKAVAPDIKPLPSESFTTKSKAEESGKAFKRVSPRLQLLATPEITAKEKNSVVSEKMDIDSTPAVPSQKPSVPRPSSTTPRVIGDSKPAAKHPPVAGKTMKRERRKSSNSSPTIPGGELRKGQRAKSLMSPGGKLKKKPPPSKDDIQDARNDFYCWICHKEGEVLCCELCPRVFHAKCLSMAEEPEGDWFCPECEKITVAECKETQSRAMSMLTIDHFSLLLKHVIQRMKIPSSEPFHEPVDTKLLPDYLDYVFHPMDLSTIEKNVKKQKYGCPEAFLSEFKWVVHNCILYNSSQSKLTQAAKAMLKVAELELSEIEVCPECYRNSCRKRDNWFCEPCKELHPLVWAKLQGFPHWPAKALRIDKGMVDVRFFGQHDRAWIPLSGCYLISKDLPLPIKNKKKCKGPGLKAVFDLAMQEMQSYIENIEKITGEFEYAPPRTLLTHCDLYRKTASVKVIQSTKTPESTDEKTSRAANTDSGDTKAKVELRDIGASRKDFVRSRIVGSTEKGLKKAKTVTTSGEHPTKSFATKKKKASMAFLSKTIESCKASLGIEKIQDVKMNSGSEESTSSSDEEENEVEDGKERTAEETGMSSKDDAALKPNADEEDSDAELVIDLGEMDESADHSGAGKATLKVGAGSDSGKASLRKHKAGETSSMPSTTKPPIKSILLNAAPKLLDKDEKKKMLAKVLSEKIGGKRRHDSEASPGLLSAKVRKTHEQQEKRSSSPGDVGKRVQKTKDKDWKKFQLPGKHVEKEGPGKVKPGILKTSLDSTGQRRGDSNQVEKRVTDPSKQRHKDQREGVQKSILKKPHQPDKPGRIVQIPTEADTRKLFNGGRIPRKNVAANASDEEQDPKDQQENNNPAAMDVGQISRSRVAADEGLNPHSNLPRKAVASKQLATADGEENVVAYTSLKKYSDKVIDSVQKVFYEMYADMMAPLASGSSVVASATAMHDVAQMRSELERLKWLHKQEVAELKHNRDLTIAEIRQSLEFEKNQLLTEERAKADAAKEQAVEETKRKQWCACCNKAAIFYCCWNTSYCDYPCQQKHWPTHMGRCTQARESSVQNGAAATETVPSSPKQRTAAPQPMDSRHGKTPPAASSATSAKKLITISASLGTIPRLSGSSERPATVVVPSCRVATVTKTQPTVTFLPPKSTAALLAVPKQHKSGSAISAIGARLLAAKQRNDEPIGKSSTSTFFTPAPVAKSSVSQPSMETLLMSSTDHVKADMESPLSPDANPSSPRTVLTSSAETKPSEARPREANKDEKQLHDSKGDVELVEVELEKEVESSKTAASLASVTSTGPRTKTTVSRSIELATSKAKTRPATAKTLSKPATLPAKAVFSSPSAVASLITEMGTPLSSTTLTSPDSSSASETPEKKADVVNPAKAQLSFGSSAFTKVVPEGGKPAMRDGSSKTSDDIPEPRATDSVPVTSKTPDPKSDAVTPEKVKIRDLPVVAPVIADDSLSSLHKTLLPIVKAPPVPTVDEDAPNVPVEKLPRPVLPESDEDKSLSESKITNSDAGEPMETDSKN